jgi:hypothetical protein
MDDNGTPRLVCAITIASGSSGCPVFSEETGEVIGIIQEVAESGVNSEGVSSSGYFGLAAPAYDLSEWLGLKY